MEIFRKMSFADSTGDAIPFYHEGKYHIFSLTSPPGTTVYPARLRTTWSHSVSDDLVHWEELPTALYPGEGDEPDASGVWTGSVIYGEGKYHAFYTGYCLTAEYQQTICHATSDDGITWVKDAANPVITPMIELYEDVSSFTDQRIWSTGSTTDRYIHRDTPTVLSALRCTRWETTGISHIQDFQNM